MVSNGSSSPEASRTRPGVARLRTVADATRTPRWRRSASSAAQIAFGSETIDHAGVTHADFDAPGQRRLQRPRLGAADLLADDAVPALQRPLRRVGAQGGGAVVDRQRADAVQVVGDAQRVQHRAQIVVDPAEQRREAAASRSTSSGPG